MRWARSCTSVANQQLHFKNRYSHRHHSTIARNVFDNHPLACGHYKGRELWVSIFRKGLRAGLSTSRTNNGLAAVSPVIPTFQVPLCVAAMVPDTVVEPVTGTGSVPTMVTGADPSAARLPRIPAVPRARPLPSTLS